MSVFAQKTLTYFKVSIKTNNPISAEIPNSPVLTVKDNMSTVLLPTIHTTVATTTAAAFAFASPLNSRLRHCRIISSHRTPTCAVTTAATATTMTVTAGDEGLKKGIAEFYDESSGMWEKIWGEHMHHGYYDLGVTASIDDHRSAQIRMIEEALRFAGVSDDPEKLPKRIVDVGCGIGGSSRYLVKKYGVQCQGITLSPIQAERARSISEANGLSDKLSFQVADALEQPFPDEQFDLVWSMESGEHMPDKTKFLTELARVAAPGATIIIVTWCHRDLLPSEESLQPSEINLLKKICDVFYLPAWSSAANYVKIAQSLGLEDIKSADWSENVAPFWPAVIKSAFTWRGFTSLISSGWKTVKGALAMPLMIEGYNKNLIKFAIITCRKPK